MWIRTPVALAGLVFLTVLVLAGVASAQLRQFDFVRHPATLAGASTQALAAADVDGDGDMDLVALRPTRWPALLLNDGEGRFVDATATHLPGTNLASVAFATGDVDSDGDVDLLWGHDYYFGSKLYLNDGTGHFVAAPAAQLPPLVSEGSLVVRLVDVDADGDLDAIHGIAWNTDMLWINDGTGRFVDETAARWPSAPPNATFDVAVGDFDHDGDVDLVTATRGRNRLVLNDGSGHFIDRSTSLPATATDLNHVVAADFDRDGDLDVYFGSQVCCGARPGVLMFNDGAGVFADVSATHLSMPPAETRDLQAADVDADGDVDVVLAIDTDRVTMLVNDGTGRLTEAPGRVAQDAEWKRSLALSDLDGDGDPDLVVGTIRGITMQWNLLRHVEAPFPPRLGADYELRMSNAPGFAANLTVALPAIAAGPGALSLRDLGTLRLDPATLVLLSPVALPTGFGNATLRLSIPADPGLTGARLYFQALILDPHRPDRLTNLWVDTVTG